MQGKFQKSFYIIPLLLSLAFSWVSSIARGDSDSSVQLHSYKTHSRLAIRVDESVNTEWKNSTTGFELFLKGIGLSDLGAPLGDEEQWKAQFKGLSDARLATLDMQEVSGGLKITGKWKYPQGNSALANPVMETFDYRDKVPPQFVIDFWVKRGPTLIEVSAAKKQSERLATLKKAEEDARQRVNRRLAAEKIKQDRENITKFCSQPLSEKNDIFLEFQPVHEKVNFGKWFSITTPDQDFHYFEPKTKTRDAQYVRVALELYRQGKPALVIRTLEFYESEHPGSEFRHEMRFLKANALIKLGLHQEAEQILSRLMVDAKNSPVALHAGMFMATKLMNEGTYLAALENFLWLISQYPEHRLNWVFHMGAAESLFALKQTDRAAKEYQWIIERADDPQKKAQAAMRMGDLYLSRQFYEQALASYFQTMKYFGGEAEKFPSAHINRAESLYSLAQYDRAKEAFEKFLKKYPAHPGGWRAAFRLGEIHGRQENGQAESRKWFYETINRYPFSAGATLARMRLVPCGDHGGFDQKAQDLFFETEVSKFDGRGEVVMSRFHDFKALTHVRALMTTGREEAALNLALKELEGQKRSEATRVLSTTLGVLYRKYILNLIAAGKKYDALQFYLGKSKSLPQVDQEIEPDYLLKLSQAASDLGLGKLGQELTKAYEQAIAGKAGRGPASVASADPTDIDEKLRVSEHHFAEAKALWISAGMSVEAKVREHLAKVSEESPVSYGRELILGLMEEKAGRTNIALNHALKAQLLMPAEAKASGEHRVACWLASLEVRVGHPDIALQMYRNLEARLLNEKKASKAAADTDLAGVLGVPPAPNADFLIMAQVELLEQSSKWGEAAATYARAAEKGWGGNQILYGYARALLKLGDKSNRSKAHATLKKVAESKENDFWKKLAREALAKEEAKEGKQ